MKTIMKRSPLARGALVAMAICLSGSACATGTATSAASVGPTPTSPTLTVPRFAVDDERVNTAGFVGQTTRMSRVVGETTYTLMIFAVGDVATLGSMVEGPFDGTATWRVGDRSFSVPLTRDDRRTAEVPVTGEDLTGRHGGFDEFDWVNVEVPLGAWLPDGTRIGLTFVSDAGTVALPEGGGPYLSAVVVR